jgi:hypothetical protein
MRVFPLKPRIVRMYVVYRDGMAGSENTETDDDKQQAYLGG